jgi:hypothetical protein
MFAPIPWAVERCCRDDAPDPTSATLRRSTIAIATRVPDARIKGDRGLNVSKIHVDVMIGCDDLTVTGTTAKGERVPIIETGVWVLK